MRFALLLALAQNVNDQQFEGQQKQPDHATGNTNIGSRKRNAGSGTYAGLFTDIGATKRAISNEYFKAAVKKPTAPLHRVK